MKRLPIITGAAAAAVLAGSLLAVPALANNDSSATGNAATSAPLSSKEKAAVDGFLDDHPRLAHALVDRAAAWDTFLTSHADIATEIAKVTALPADQRRTALRQWLAEHPAARATIRQWRGDQRSQRQDQRQQQRQDRRSQRQDRRAGAGAAGPTSLSG